MGLTGLIVEVGLKLKKYNLPYCQTTIKTQNLKETFDVMEKNLSKNTQFVIGYISSKKKSRERFGIFGQTPDKNILIKTKKKLKYIKNYS